MQLLENNGCTVLAERSNAKWVYIIWQKCVQLRVSIKTLKFNLKLIIQKFFLNWLRNIRIKQKEVVICKWNETITKWKRKLIHGLN
jgi:hypothetical protein